MSTQRRLQKPSFARPKGRVRTAVRVVASRTASAVRHAEPARAVRAARRLARADQRNNGYRIIVQEPGEGYCHVVTPEQVRERLAPVPQEFLKGLEVVQFSRMTRKKQSFPCYGMQWGSTLYLYPLEESLEEWFTIPPRTEVVNEARMYGGRWDEPAHGLVAAHLEPRRRSRTSTSTTS